LVRITERPLFEIGDSFGITIPMEWLKKHDLKKGDKVHLKMAGDYILIEPPKTEEELLQEILEVKGCLEKGLLHEK